MGFLPFHVEQNIEKRKLISPHTQFHHIVATLQKKISWFVSSIIRHLFECHAVKWKADHNRSSKFQIGTHWTVIAFFNILSS